MGWTRGKALEKMYTTFITEAYNGAMARGRPKST
jgi:hypothetical protein